MRVSIRLLTGDLKSNRVIKKMKITNLKSLIISFFVVGLCFLVFISNTETAVYYVSAGGSDIDSGTESQPWNHCPGMPD